MKNPEPTYVGEIETGQIVFIEEHVDKCDGEEVDDTARAAVET